MQSGPLVTVVCLNHNQAAFLEEAIVSVLAQTYKPIQLIIVDDASSDESQALIDTLNHKYPNRFQTILLPDNLGNCPAFNQALRRAKGKYIIDLAADDVLLPDRVATGVNQMEALGEQFAVQFSDANIINTAGQHLFRFYEDKPAPPSGEVYEELIRQAFICSPSTMFNTAALKDLGGYDEALSYEDFDIWLRMARHYQFCYVPEVLVKKRKVAYSRSIKQWQKNDEQRQSTLRICQKIYAMNRTRSEEKALMLRIVYEIQQAMLLKEYVLAEAYLALLRKLNPSLPLKLCYQWMVKLKLPLHWLKRFSANHQ